MPDEVAEAEAETTEGQEAPQGLMSYGDEPAKEEAKKEEGEDAKEEGSTEEGGKEETLLAGKYKSVEELEKGYINAQKALSTRNAPDKYDISKEVKDFVKDDADMFESFQKVAKETDLSQEGFNKIIEWRMGEIKALMAKHAEQEKAELKKLGNDSSTRISAVRAYLSSNLSQAEYNSLQSKLSTADDITAIEKLISKATSVVPQGGRVAQTPSSIKDMENRLDRLIDKQAKETGMPDEALADEIQKLAKRISKAKGD